MSNKIVDFKKRQEEKREKQNLDEEREQEYLRVKQLIEFPEVTLADGTTIKVNGDGLTATIRNAAGLVLCTTQMTPMEKLLLQNIVMIEMKTLSVLEVYCPEIINWDIPPSHSISIDDMHERREKQKEQINHELPPSPEPT